MVKSSAWNIRPASRRTLLVILLILTGSIGFFIHCSEEVSGPVNSAPVIDSIILDPDALHPGSDVVMTAVASDADGDSLSYKWATYPNAGKFSNTTLPVCTLTVSAFLKGGMFLKTTLQVSDSKTTTEKEVWIPLVAGQLVSGYVYYANTLIPVPGVEVAIGRLFDSSTYRGSYGIHHVAPGQRTITAGREGCDVCSYDLDVTGDMIYDVYIDCPRLVKTIRGDVSTREGVLLSNVRVTVLNKDKSRTELSGDTDDNGEFLIESVPPGKRLFTIDDLGNPNYAILSDTFEVQFDSDTSINLRGRVRDIIFGSTGIASPEKWLFESNPTWKSWYVDYDNQCLAYNSCSAGGSGKLSMATPVAIPPDAGGITWSAEVSLVDALCVIAFVVDGLVINCDDIGYGTKDVVMEKIVNIPASELAGHNFAVEFYAWNVESERCATICLKRFTLAQYQ